MIHELKNFGVIRKELPKDLFSKLKDECLNASSETHEVLISGLTEPGVPLHYYVKDNKQELKKCCIDIANQYLDEHNPAVSYKFKTEGKQPKQFYPADPWINYQKKHQYIPNHDHTGFLAYTIWVNIPETSVFEFMYSTITGEMFRERIMVKKETEGTIMIFPSKLIHCVYPFFNSEETRISISGNLYFE
jgi:hypothetical protein